MPEDKDAPYQTGKGPRYDLSNKEIKTYLDAGESVGAVARRFACSNVLVMRVRDGIRKDQIEPPNRYRLNGRKPCSCCKIRPIKKGNHFLCEECFKNGSDDEEECPPSTSGK